MSGQEGQQQKEASEIGKKGSPRSKNSKRKALIIAISDYDNLPKPKQLPFCRNDGEEMYQVLSKQEYKIPTDFKLIGKVEGNQMKDAIIDFFRNAKPTDTLIFYFSGHGMPDGYGNYFLAASDIDPKVPERRGYSFYELEQQRKRCISRRIVTILDCCFSGAAQSGTTMEVDEEGIANVARDKMDNTFREGEGRCLLASSLGDQLSYKMKDKDYSIFTYFLKEAVEGANGKSADTKGYVTLSALSNYVYEMVTAKGHQKPIVKTAQSGDIIIAHHPSLEKIQQHQTSQTDYLLKLLIDGKIDEFNKIRKEDNYSELVFYNVDLTGRHLPNADFRKCDFSLAKLKGAKLYQAIFVEASISGARLEFADLSGADLTGAKLSSANLLKSDLSSANLSTANLTNANLTGAKLSSANLLKSDLSTANLTNANLTNANLTGAKLIVAKLIVADLSGADLTKADLSSTNLYRADLSGADLTGAKLYRADLSGADLSGADLTGAKLLDANLTGADLTGAKLLKADLTKADLSGAKLLDANLSESKLFCTYLSKTDITGVDLSNADLSSSIITGLKFSDNNNDTSYPLLCKDTKFNNATIIDDEKLCIHFRNNNSKPDTVPPAVKDKEELREKLEKRRHSTLSKSVCSP